MYCICALLGDSRLEAGMTCKPIKARREPGGQSRRAAVRE